ncbi:MarR family winged helix-turn-helix transcriptional regulator [Arthrobacter sp.]|uniref:MarR family winged helix-turn-helix transcriptional regulator n=1 Tax=Arthrobacter sp. TaxID=1667 RepID=UPI003A92FDF8
MPKPASLRETTQAWEALFNAQVTIMRRLQRHPAFKKLTMREYDVLVTLGKCPIGGIRLGALNENVLLSQPSLSRMVDRLEAKGFVSRCGDPADQRAVLLTLTDEGRSIQRQIGREHVRHIHELLGSGLDAEEFAELTRLTRKLGAAVQARD